MTSLRLILLTSACLAAFAGNSVLCRLALAETTIDPAGFTALRIVSGAVMLCVLVRAVNGGVRMGGNWASALALFTYAAAFSFAYVELTAATGALLLFGVVQSTMIGAGLWKGETLRGVRLAGFLVALAGMTSLLLPGIGRPPLAAALLMACAGTAWTIYSLQGRSAVHPLAETAGNFVRASVFALLLALACSASFSFDVRGAGYAVASGAVTSGIGYALWYRALPSLRATDAATLQLLVPVLAAVAGIVLLGETLSLRLALCALAVLGGTWLVVRGRRN